MMSRSESFMDEDIPGVPFLLSGNSAGVPVWPPTPPIEETPRPRQQGGDNVSASGSESASSGSGNKKKRGSSSAAATTTSKTARVQLACPFRCLVTYARRDSLATHVTTNHANSAGPFRCAGCDNDFGNFDAFWKQHLNEGFEKQSTEDGETHCCPSAYLYYFTSSQKKRRQSTPTPAPTMPPIVLPVMSNGCDETLKEAYFALARQLHQHGTPPIVVAENAKKLARAFLLHEDPKELMALFLSVRSDRHAGFPLLEQFVGRAFLGDSGAARGGSVSAQASHVLQLWDDDARRTEWLTRGRVFARDLSLNGGADLRTAALADVINQLRRALRSFVFSALKFVEAGPDDELLSLALQSIVTLCFPLDLFNALYQFNEHYIGRVDLPQCRAFLPEGDKYFVDDNFYVVVNRLGARQTTAVSRLGRLLITPLMWLPLQLQNREQSPLRFLHQQRGVVGVDAHWELVHSTLREFDESNPHCQRREI